MDLEHVRPLANEQGSIQIVRAPEGPGYRLEAVQWLPQPREQIFEFFSDAFQLEALTPPWMHFAVLTPPPIKIASGALIDYRLRVHHVPLHWRSCISHWDPPARFVDEQVRGPYRRWRHQHIFEASDGGTLCRDIVDYDVYGGSLIHRIFVRRDLIKIFTYRQSKLRALFC